MKCRLGSLLTGGLLAALIGLAIAIPVLVLVEWLRSKEKAEMETVEKTETD